VVGGSAGKEREEVGREGGREGGGVERREVERRSKRAD